MPVTAPLVELTVAMPVLLLLQVPPAGDPVPTGSAAAPEHTCEVVTDTVGGGVTLTVAVFVQPEPRE